MIEGLVEKGEGINKTNKQKTKELDSKWNLGICPSEVYLALRLYTLNRL